jgi:hypothetical protein
MADSRVCSESNCDKPIYCKGVCKTHYHRFYARKHRHREGGIRCSVDGCERAAVTRGWCGMHYSRWSKAGSTDEYVRQKAISECAVDGCDGTVLARGWCLKHYQRWWNHDDPLNPGKYERGEPLRFLREVVLNYEGDDCLKWPYGGSGSYGYGKISYKGKPYNVHRLVCELVNGPPPFAKAVARHLCGHGDQGCCAKSHIAWGTQKENMADAVRHGRDNRGERCGSAKLTRDQVREIRKLEGVISQDKIAAKFGVGRGAIKSILNGKSWRWLD